MADKKERHYKSLNEETGMIEDINEVRDLSLRIIKSYRHILSSPIVQLATPYSMQIDLVTMLASAESMIRHMSQADYLRIVGTGLGATPSATEEYIKLLGASETLALTHPDAPRPDIDEEMAIDPNDPLFKGSYVVEQIAEMHEDRKKQEPTQPKVNEPPVELPGSIEEFLKGLGLE